MSIYNTLARHIMAPTVDVLRNAHTVQSLEELEQSQWWSRERLEELQNARLRQLIVHAYEHVPYYRQLMHDRHITPSDVRTAADMHVLPVLTRQQVQQSLEDMVADNWPRQRLHSMSTSGSTGIPLRFYSTREDQVDRGYARSIRAMSWAGIALGDRIARIGRIHHARTRRGRLLQSVSSRLQRSWNILLDDLSDDALRLLVRRIADAHLVGIRSYPNALALIAGYIKDNDAPRPVVRSIVTGAAEILSHERRIIREIFGGEPHSDYSSSEVLEIASECSAHQGLHVSMEDLVLEILDDQGKPLPPGTEGRIVLTNLHNYGMPLIRYEIGDSGSLVEGDCPCGRTLPRISALVGRRDQFFTTRTGARMFFGSLFLEDLAGLGMRQYQLVQESIESVVMRLVAPRDASQRQKSDIEQRVLTMFQSRLGPELQLQVEFVDRIAPTAEGKHVFMISRVPGQRV
ncbi:MAG: phenylacetate--CoA ligase family protein [Dehalococcoidia bacterium]|nr:phenylacetate--CoA ligase family protein [Dehalococcoidia bacterium]